MLDVSARALARLLMTTAAHDLRAPRPARALTPRPSALYLPCASALLRPAPLLIRHAPPALLSSLSNDDDAARCAPSSSDYTSHDDGGARPSRTRSHSTSMPSPSPLSAPRPVPSAPPSSAPRSTSLRAPLPVLRHTAPRFRSTCSCCPLPDLAPPLPPRSLLSPFPRSMRSPPLSASPRPPPACTLISSCPRPPLPVSLSPIHPLRSPLLPQPPPSRYTASPSSPPRPNRDTCHRIT
ncbi:hypothetical protein C8R44DRAFT_232392 [Mycena epipterygia]|nr:hypothetical protein C8R44DRAFT_232392 [Mycena epipterygia]